MCIGRQGREGEAVCVVGRKGSVCREARGGQVVCVGGEVVCVWEGR